MSPRNEATRKQLEITGEAPHCAIIGCADARAPLETIFDAMPGAVDAETHAWIHPITRYAQKKGLQPVGEDVLDPKRR